MIFSSSFFFAGGSGTTTFAAVFLIFLAGCATVRKPQAQGSGLTRKMPGFVQKNQTYLV